MFVSVANVTKKLQKISLLYQSVFFCFFLLSCFFIFHFVYTARVWLPLQVMPSEISGNFKTDCLNTSFFLAIPLFTGYSVKLREKNSDQFWCNHLVHKPLYLISRKRRTPGGIFKETWANMWTLLPYTSMYACN